MKISEMVEPTPVIVNEIKKAYNRVLIRCNEASKYLDRQDIPQTEKENRTITFKIEVVDVLEAYLQVLKDWGVTVTDDEILGGMKIE